MKLVLATGNKGKLREFRQMCEGEVLPFSDLLGEMEIVEDGDTFAANALIKARTIYEKLGEGHLVIADDSGISLPILDGAPGIYSARYAGEGASDKDNLHKLIDTLKQKGVKETTAYYTAAIAIVGGSQMIYDSSRGDKSQITKPLEYVVHGWMHGEVIDNPRGEKGFGYDPMFVPEGYDKTLGELDDDIKSGISHRAKALALAKPIIKMLHKK